MGIYNHQTIHCFSLKNASSFFSPIIPKVLFSFTFFKKHLESFEFFFSVVSWSIVYFVILLFFASKCAVMGTAILYSIIFVVFFHSLTLTSLSFFFLLRSLFLIIFLEDNMMVLCLSHNSFVVYFFVYLNSC